MKKIDCNGKTVTMVLDEICPAGSLKGKGSPSKRSKKIKGDYDIQKASFSADSLVELLKIKGVRASYRPYSTDANDFCLSIF